MGRRDAGDPAPDSSLCLSPVPDQVAGLRPASPAQALGRGGAGGGWDAEDPSPHLHHEFFAPVRDHELCSVPDRVSGLRPRIRYPAWAPAAGGPSGPRRSPKPRGGVGWTVEGMRMISPPLHYVLALFSDQVLCSAPDRMPGHRSGSGIRRGHRRRGPSGHRRSPMPGGGVGGRGRGCGGSGPPFFVMPGPRPRIRSYVRPLIGWLGLRPASPAQALGRGGATVGGVRMIRSPFFGCSGPRPWIRSCVLPLISWPAFGPILN